MIWYWAGPFSTWKVVPSSPPIRMSLVTVFLTPLGLTGCIGVEYSVRPPPSG